MKKFFKTLGILAVTGAMILSLCLYATSAINAAELPQENFLEGFDGNAKKNKYVNTEILECLKGSVESFQKQSFYLKFVKNQEYAQNALEAMESEYPELYQFTINGVSAGQSLWLGNFLVFTTFDYTMSESKYKKSLKTIEEIRDQIVAECQGKTDFEKELYIYEYIGKNCDYRSTKRLDSTMYGVFINGKANCTGLSKAFKYLANACGLQCEVMGGYKKDNTAGHSWNIVKIDGEWYVVDLTKETGMNEETNMGADGLIYHGLNITDTGYSDTYIPDDIYYNAPKCTATRMNYFVAKNLYYDGTNESTVFENVAQLMKATGSGSISCVSAETCQQLRDNIEDLQDVYYDNYGESIALVYYTINDTCLYIKIDK